MKRLVIALTLLVSLVSCREHASSAKRVAVPAVHESYTVREGRVLFTHYCAGCHGTEGEGDGFNAYSLDPKPRDLADPKLQSERTDEDLVRVIRLGGGAVGLSTGMPPWGRALSAREIRNVVAFLRTLRAASAPR